MSEEKLISPMLDGFVMGEPMSDHDGVRCCPAMRENSDDKYIVKIVSVPASQKQLDALLLTQAYPDAAAAMNYFKELTDGVVKEANLLQQLARLEGFLPYSDWQVVPMVDNNLGYDIYLLSDYRRSLEKFLRRNNMTHLGAVNLGLDLCAALAICRRAGFMYVDLKPTNIYLTGEREYRIGDLGFLQLRSMKYTSLPSKYLSAYTPPEMHDALATLNPTLDTYAVGMILYQIYNDGKLPFDGKPGRHTLPAPMNADYEMAEIIGKACAPNPRNRYQTPIEMGQALVSYLQRNTVNDVPIVPPAATPVAEPEEHAPAAEEAAAALQQPVQAPAPLDDETLPSSESCGDLSDSAATEEVSSMLAQADDLLADPTPEAETPAAPQPMQDDDEAIGIDINAIIGEDRPAPAEDDDDDDDDYDWDADAAPKKKRRSWIGVVITLLVLALLVGGSYYFYENYYMLDIASMDIQGFENAITVLLNTNADEALLSVVCTDTYGNTQTLPLKDGKAVFTDLTPGTLYTITVKVEGFHKLSGSTTGKYNTAEQTTILDFSAKTGHEDGSVILNFAVEGPETQDWVVEYSADGEEPRSASFTGHMVTINGLTVGKLYTFRLVPPPATDLYMVGNNTLQFTASQMIVAENLSITSCVGGVLTAEWDVPEGINVESWTVRCYADAGYDETMVVNENRVQFAGIDTAYAYTVEVVADGMTQSARAFVTTNSTTVTSFTVKQSGSNPLALSIKWDYEGNPPADGWLLMYSIEGTDREDVIRCQDNSALLELGIPGATYHFNIQSADGATVFGSRHSYTNPEAEDFNKFSLSASKIESSLCRTPEKANWTYKDVDNDAYTNKFQIGESAALVLHAQKKFNLTKEDISILFVIRDADGNVLVDFLATQTKNWKSMWSNLRAPLELPYMPDQPGSYSVTVYFNGCFATKADFTIA